MRRPVSFDAVPVQSRPRPITITAVARTTSLVGLGVVVCAAHGQAPGTAPPEGTATVGQFYLAIVFCATVVIGLAVVLCIVRGKDNALDGIFRSPNSFRGAALFVIVVSSCVLAVLDRFTTEIATLYGAITGYALGSGDLVTRRTGPHGTSAPGPETSTGAPPSGAS